MSAKSLDKDPAVRLGDNPRKITQGSETSQYLEEEKSTEIPLVVASERGTAQTHPTMGVAGLVRIRSGESKIVMLGERSWKGRPKRVRVP